MKGSIINPQNFDIQPAPGLSKNQYKITKKLSQSSWSGIVLNNQLYSYYVSLLIPIEYLQYNLQYNANIKLKNLCI